MAHHDDHNIAAAPSKAFAEYVVTSFPDPGSASSLPKRPSLLFRVHSDRLRVQANAKSLRERLLSGPLVDIYVGKERKHWALHRNLLSYHSDAIEAELSILPMGNSKSKGRLLQDEARLDLPDIDPSGFELLLKWLYQGKLDDVSEITDPQEKYAYAIACFNLHKLCTHLDMITPMNNAMDQYRKGLHQAELVPDAEEINELYQGTPAGSPFRKLLTRIAARQIMDPDSDKDAGSYRKCFERSPDFAIDLINTLKSSTGGVLLDDPTEEDGDGCEYHDHETGSRSRTKGKARSGKYATAPLPSP